MKSFKNLLLKVSSWNDFVSLTNNLSAKDKGDIFEYLTKLILLTHPKYKLQLKKVWLQQEGIPNEISVKLNLPTTDEGIDIIVETISGEYWAIQCKYKGMNETPTYKELSTFSNLANSYCKNISLALLVHTGEKGVKKRVLLGENYSEIGLVFWLELKSEDWDRIHKYIKGKSIRPKAINPRPHQQQAIRKAVIHFQKKNARRGKMIMPCGTGKSLTSFWIAQKLEAKSIIVAVPSLALIKQSLEGWAREFVAHEEEPKPKFLVICSDESTGQLNKDEFVSDSSSLGIPTTTDVEKITHFLTEYHIGRKIIFITYQSSDKLAQAAKICRFNFDLAILDEAHKTVGVKSKTFAILLLDKNISISKRLFMTATERIFRGSNDDIHSMDNEKIYGKVFFQLSFKDAIHCETPIICDYKILTITVTNDEIKQMISRNNFLTDNEKKVEEQEAQYMASAIALRKATQKYNINHVISFHRSIKSAVDFAKLNSTLNLANYDDVFIKSSHISSKKSAGERAKLLMSFTHEKQALMTNARCLTEGVDIPAIDCVLFADPRQSIIDIVQASGRALRPYNVKTFGYIMLPLIVPDNQNLEDFAETTAFKTVAKIISALSTQDERIAEEFRLINTGKQFSREKIIIDGNIPVGMNLDLELFAECINTKIWENVARANPMPFKDARAFVHTLKLKNSDEWYNYCKSGKNPPDIPTSVYKIYRNKGWKSWGDWLGTYFINHRDRSFLPFEEARKFARSLKLKGYKEWREHSASKKIPQNIPSMPNRTYRNTGWINIDDWLGTGYRSFEEAKEYMHTLKLRNTKEWKKFCRSGKKPDDIPSAPEKCYKGWKGHIDWLGTGNVDLSKKGNRKYGSYEEVKKAVRTLNLKSKEDWEAYCKAKGKPFKFPPRPQYYYKNDGWIGWDDWLGISNEKEEINVIEELEISVTENK